MKEKNFEIEWSEASPEDNGKQSDFATGASHPGCCKQ